MRFTASVLAFLLASRPVLAGQGGGSSSHNKASHLDEYCFYTIYTILSEYTFEGSVTISSSSGGSDSESHGSSSSSSSSSSSNGTSSSSSASASSSSAVKVTPHGRKRDIALERRHGGSSSVSTGPCNSTVEVTSMYASAKAWCSAKDFKAAIPYWQSLCEQNSLTLMSLTSIEAKVTDEYIDGLSTIDPDNNSTTTTGTIDEAVHN